MVVLPVQGLVGYGGFLAATFGWRTLQPFARVRNPFYLACFLASASVLVAVPSLVALGGLALHIAAAEIIVRRVEEPILAQAHGTAFASYMQRTGRFLPRLSEPQP